MVLLNVFQKQSPTMQIIYILFSCSPKRWKYWPTDWLFASWHIWHQTVWSSWEWKSFVAHLTGVKLALEDLLELNLTPKCRNEIHGAMCNVSSFSWIIMSVVWYRILVSIDFYNKVIQASDLTLDMEVANIESLLAQLVAIRDSWKVIWNEAKLVASSRKMEVILIRDHSTTARKRTWLHDDDTPDEHGNQMNEADESPDEAHFRKHISYVVLNNVIGGLTVRFSAPKQISDTFSFHWNYQMILRE